MKRILVFIALLFACNLTLIAQIKKQPVNQVYPLLDAANSRWFYFSSAARPFGMVSLFPDNYVAGDWGSGYRYNTDTIRDFSHIHEWQLSGVAVMPLSYSPDEVPSLFKNDASAFSHSKETVRPGYHSVVLDRYQTKVELTATNRVGFHRYNFPAGKQNGVLFELGGQLGPSRMIEGGFEQINDHEIRGYVINGVTGRRPKTYNVYFSAVFQQSIKKIYLYVDKNIKEGEKKWNGKNGKIIVELQNGRAQPVLMKVGLSYTSEEAAANNREKELADWQFDKAVSQAGKEWNDMLSRIQIEGGTEQQQQRFYTDLWHAIQGRRMINDIDGKYADFTGKERVIKQVPLDKSGKPTFNMYNSDSFWGAQWTLNTLWDLVYPEVAQDFINSFLEYYRNGGLIPRGPSGGNYTAVMTGAQTTSFYVSAWQKGIRGFDINEAYAGLKKNHLPGGMMGKAGYEHNSFKGGGIEYYMAKGYVPYPISDTAYGIHQDGATMTLENSYQDWCLAQLAKILGKTDDYNYFLKRSDNFKNLYNSALGFMVPKDKEGKWRTPFDPLEYEHGFEEGNGAQYRWWVPHNLNSLFTLMGGKDSSISKLNRQFELSRPTLFCDTYSEKGVVKTNRRVWINYSNQPNIQAAFIFNYAGAPWLTQYWSRQVIDKVYSDLTPQAGYNGDEDQGMMGSLSVLMKIGLFQMTGGCEENPKYEIGSPIFNKITIQLDPKYYKVKQFTIVAKNASASNMYIQSATIGNKPLNEFFIRHSDIKAGKSLIINMGSQPSLWGKQK